MFYSQFGHEPSRHLGGELAASAVLRHPSACWTVSSKAIKNGAAFLPPVCCEDEDGIYPRSSVPLRHRRWCLVEKFRTFVIQWLFAMFTRASHWILSWDSWTKCTHVIQHPSISSIVFQVDFSHHIFRLIFPYSLLVSFMLFTHLPPPLHHFYFIWWTLQLEIIECLIIYFSSPFLFSVPSAQLSSSNSFQFRYVLQRNKCLDRGARGKAGISWIAYSPQYVTTLTCKMFINVRWRKAAVYLF